MLSAETMKSSLQGEQQVLCIAGQSPIDEAAALMLSQILIKHGLPASTLAAESLSSLKIATLVETAPALICLCYLGADSTSHMRYAVKRLRRRLPSAFIIVAALSSENVAAGDGLDIPADAIASTLRDVSKACLLQASRVQSDEAHQQPDTSSGG